MTATDIQAAESAAAITQSIIDRDLVSLARTTAGLSAHDLVQVCGRLSETELALMFRSLPKDLALEVFESLPPALQSDLVHGLQDVQITDLFAELDPDERAWLFDELPASVALTRVRSHGRDAETIYTLPVVDAGRQLVGVVSLRDLFEAEAEEQVSDLMQKPHSAEATASDEGAARQRVDKGLLALPVVDRESRLVGILTIDDAERLLRDAEKEDSARQGGVEPLSRPYLSTPALSLMRSRVTWLLVLAVGATLTVQVLAAFEATLEEVTVLALFVPLLIGTGGNTRNQAATTVTRALAMNEVQPRDVLRVLAREFRVGASLGLLLGALGFSLTARTIGADPAVFSNPFISTFVDAAGLVIYFLIAIALLGI